jgi:hypothetical protein
VLLFQWEYINCNWKGLHYASMHVDGALWSCLPLYSLSYPPSAFPFPFTLPSSHLIFSWPSFSVWIFLIAFWVLDFFSPSVYVWEENMWYFYLWDWLTSFNVMISSSTHSPTNNIILFVFMTELNSIVYIYHIFFIHTHGMLTKYLVVAYDDRTRQECQRAYGKAGNVAWD